MLNLFSKNDKLLERNTSSSLLLRDRERQLQLCEENQDKVQDKIFMVRPFCNSDFSLISDLEIPLYK